MISNPTHQRLSEKRLQEMIIQACHYLGWLAYHTFDSRRSAAGFVDLVLVKPGQGILFVELKSSKGRLRAEQRVWIDALRAAGAECYIWRPCDIDQALARLAQ